MPILPESTGRQSAESIVNPKTSKQLFYNYPLELIPIRSRLRRKKYEHNDKPFKKLYQSIYPAHASILNIKL